MGERSGVKVRRDDVRLDAKKLCGVRFVPDDSLVFEDGVVVYRVGHHWGEEVPATEGERARWAGAEQACLDALSRALVELHRAHGGRYADVDLYGGRRAWSAPGEPAHWPGWRKRLAERSAQAQRAYLAAVEQARAAYRPVREEIEARLEAHRAERVAAERARRREAERRRRIMLDVAAQRVWRYSTENAENTDNTRHAVVSVRRAGPADDDGAPLNAHELEAALLDLTKGAGARPRVEWDPAACAEVERECRERGVDVTFAAWWQEVTRERWDTRGPTTGSAPVHVSTHHTGYGIGHPGGFDGGSSHGGFSHGGFSHGGGHGFGTSF